mmetsp:Transcript_5168/g.5306  ORF Transcript_5168/g.5306 Transcript_5168/m.5306 type:complete len:82 (-) Transcript_5168:410-655(-)
MSQNPSSVEKGPRSKSEGDVEVKVPRESHAHMLREVTEKVDVPKYKAAAPEHSEPSAAVPGKILNQQARPKESAGRINQPR